jgi:hypothetical protein
MENTIVIRPSRRDDVAALFRIAALDSAQPLVGDDVLVAELGGEVVAAYAAAERRSVADPFRPTAALVDLLRMRADQLTSATVVASRPAHARSASAYA